MSLFRRLPLDLNGCPSYVTRGDEKKSWFWKRGAVNRQDGENKEEDVTLYFQLIGEMKGFIVQYIAHGESRPVVIAAGHK